MGARRLFLGALLALGIATAVPAQQMQIQFAEPIALTAAPGAAQFDAYGQRFPMVLETNDRLLKGVPAARKAALGMPRLLRGAVSGRPGSWVRLVTDGSEVAGAIWDGTDLYVIARHDRIAHLLTNPLAAGDLQTVVYRLSDTLNALPANFCAAEPATGSSATSANGLAQFKALIGELKLQFVAAPTDAIDISLIADATLQQLYSSPGDNLALAMLNTLGIVDGIFDSQLGLMIGASDLRLAPVAQDPFTSTDASTLLGELRTYRNAIPAVQSRPIAHLLTGRRLNDGVTLGIAVLSGACNANDGVSLSAANTGLGSNIALVMAHEIGHNLGAEHDTPACGESFLMWPEYSWQTTPIFSQCSRDQIRPFLVSHRGSCVTPPSYGDAETRIPAIAQPIATEPFNWPVFVRSAGTAPLTGAEVSLNIQGVTINSAIPTSGTCAPLNGDMRCQFGTLAAGTEARVDFNLTASHPDNLQLSANANGTNDRYETNNLVYANTTVRPRAILAVSVDPATRSAQVGQTVSYTFTLVSSGARTAQGVVMTLGGSYFTNTGATPSQGACAVGPTAVSCNLGDIPSGATAQVVLEGHAIQGVSVGIGANVTSTNALMTQSNVTATLNATATFDLALDGGPAFRVLATGVPYDFVIPVRANGTRPVVGGLFRMNSGGATILSADVDGVACAANVLQSALGGGCPLGTINAGERKTVTVRMQYDTARDTGVYVTADILDDELWTNNSANLTFSVRAATDVGIGMSSNSAGNTERQNFQAVATLSSQGVGAAANVAATLDVPVGVRILSATLPQGVCTLSGDRRITCTRATLPLTEQPQMSVTLVGDEPAQYTGAFTVTADNDGVPSNNSLSVTISIGPLTDVGLNPIATLPGFIVGQPREFTVEVVTGAVRPAQNVVVTFPSSPSLVVEAISTPVGTCVVAGTSPHCDLGDLAPNSLVRVTPRYRATAGGSGLSGWVMVSAARDVDYTNNDRHVDMNTYDAGDISLQVAAATITGNIGSTMILPRITLTTISRSQDVHIDIPIPAFATVESVSFAAGICTGTTTLQCYMSQRESGASDVLDVTLRLNSTGTFTSSMVVRASNDTNPANDTSTMQIQANAVSTPPVTPPAGSSSGGGGGGGRLEWLLLGLLGILAARRIKGLNPMGWCVVALMLSPVHAATQKTDVEQSSLAKGRELTVAVMNLVVAGDDRGAAELLRPNLPIPKSEFNAVRDKTIEQRRAVAERFGKILGYKFVREERVSDFLIRLTYVEKRANHFVRWQFTFYRPQSEWRLNSFVWDDNVEGLFSTSAPRQ